MTMEGLEEEREYTFVIAAEQAGERLDKWVAAVNEEWSRVRVQAWIREGYVAVDGRPQKGNYRLKKGEQVVIHVPPLAELSIAAEAMPLDIRYEDADVLVVNKPRGLVVHPAPGHHSGTLVNALLAHCRGNLSGIHGVARPGIVHRIDKDTSGLLMIAKNEQAHQSLIAQLQAHTVERIYVAVVHGVIPHEHGTIDAPIGRDPNQRQQMRVIHTNSKPAITHFTVRARFAQTTIVECRLETGRTHQIRVHMKYIGFPLVGDPLYGPKKNPYPIHGQALHAKVLGFTHPRTAERIRIEAELPQEMEELLAFLRGG
jgi:23S rRNA pseudouridine1911/1915/1917 synthase